MAQATPTKQKISKAKKQHTKREHGPTLIVVESPAKARTVEKFLGEDFIVMPSVGHVRDLPKSNKKAIDIDAGFQPHYEIVKGKESTIHELQDAVDRASDVVIATDPDREGEAIAWHLKQVLELKNPKRIVFHEITREAIEEALQEPRDIDESLKTAQEARRVLDRLFGYDLSGLIWKKLRYGLSAGRVQSPALRILMEREREIQAFKPQDYWVITADVTTAHSDALQLTCTEEPTLQERTDAIVSAARQASWQVADVRESETKRSPRAPFITSTMQQAASSRLGFTPSRTMRIAQQLYEAGLITYMRTDSTNLSQQAKQQIGAYIKEQFGNEYAETHAFKTQSKLAQEAHEAIRPTNVKKAKAGKTDEQKKLYDLIWRRTVASQMAPAKLKKTKLTAHAQSSDTQIPAFTANGQRVIFDGWLRADPHARGEDTEVPAVEAGESLTLKYIASEHKQTQPPSRYTEAGLIKELEKRGIGRPSTYATIMRTLNDRGYVTKDGKTLIPTDTGAVVSDFLENHFAHYISDSFTAEMEDELDEIARGERNYVQTLQAFYSPFTSTIDEKQDLEKISTLGDAPAEFTCPKCANSMVYKLGKGGVFLSCSQFPDCDGARTREGDEIKGPEETGESCPQCGNPLVERDGRYGRFVSCSNYPKCKYVKRDEEQLKQASSGVTCPRCNSGELIERRGRFGPFYSCSSYPDCKFAMKAKPTGNTCPQCGALMMEGTKTIPERCSDKNCPNYRPDKQQS